MAAGIRRTRYLIVGLLFVATVISYLNRQALSVNAPLLRDELGLSNTQYSRIVFAFLVAYTFSQAGSGWLIDRLGTRLGFSISVAWWSIAGMLHATAQGAVGLSVWRFFLGIGQAGSWPGSMRAVAEWFPPRDRAAAVGVFGSGTSFGAVLAPPLVVLITLHLGWRAPFLVMGLLGFLWLAVWLLVYWPPQRHPRFTTQDIAMLDLAAHAPGEGRDGSYSWYELLKERKVWGVVLGRLGADPAWWFFVFWLPEYLVRARGYSIEQMGYLGWIPYFACYVGNLAGGFVSSSLIRRGWSVDAGRKTVLYSSALGMTAALPAAIVEDASLNLAFISLATLSFGAWATNMLTVSADIAPPGAVGSITGLGGMGAGIGAMAFTLLTGWLVDNVGYVPVFAIATLMPLGAAAAIALVLGRIEPIHRRASPARV